MNILPHVRFQCLVRPSFPTCTVPVKIFELSVPLLPHVQFQPNMHYPFLAHVRSKLQLIKNHWPKNILKKITDQKIFSRHSFCLRVVDRCVDSRRNHVKFLISYSLFMKLSFIKWSLELILIHYIIRSALYKKWSKVIYYFMK